MVSFAVQEVFSLICPICSFFLLFPLPEEIYQIKYCYEQCPRFCCLCFLLGFLWFSVSLSFCLFLTLLCIFTGIINQINCWHVIIVSEYALGKPKLRQFILIILESTQCICFNQLMFNSMLTQLFGIKIFKNSFIIFIHSYFMLGYPEGISRYKVISILIQHG